jgi:NADH-quinone oxidoreductase subunit L
VVGAVFTPIFAKINPKLKNYAPVVFAAASVVFSFSMIPDVFTGTVVDWASGKTLGPIPYDWQTPWVGSLGINLGVIVDPLSVLMTSLVCSIGLLVLTFSIGYMRGDPGLTRYWFLTQLFIGGLSMVVMSSNLLQLYIGWEVVGVSCYALVSFWYRNPQNARYGLKTFLVLRVGDVLLLASILTMYFYSGTFNFLALKQSNRWIMELSRSGLLLTTAIMFFAGAVSKSAQFPLHVWLPDALPSSPASFNAITEVLAGVFLVARALPMFHEALVGGCEELILFFLVVAWTGAFTALLGASMAMVQRNIVKVLSYSIISQYAYMMASLGVGGLMTNRTAGYLAANLHLMVDAVVSGLLFLSAAAIIHRVQSQDMFDMGGLRTHMPITFKCMAVGALATIGIPPLSGFWSEESIYAATLEHAQEASQQGNFNLMLSAYGLYILLIITAAITTFYVLRMMGMVFGRKKSRHLKKLEREGKPVKEVTPIMWVPMGVAALATVIIGVLAPFFITEFHKFFSPLIGQNMIHEGSIDVLRAAFLTPSFGVTCVALAIGGYPAYRLYITSKTDPTRITEEHQFLRSIHKFLWNRCFLNSFSHAVASLFRIASEIMYKSLEHGIDAFNFAAASFFRRLSNIMYKNPELKGIDALNYFLARLITSFCQRFRKTHTGVLDYNMLAAFIGAVLVIALLILFGGLIP